MNKTSIIYTCKNCEHEFELDLEYSTPIPAKISGPPEHCHPAEGGEVEIFGDEYCPQCKVPINIEKVEEQLWDKLEDEKSHNESDYEPRDRLDNE